MGIFRRRRTPGPDATLTAGYPAGVAVAPIRTAAAGAHAPAGQVQGWAGLGVQLPPNYAGSYSGTPVSMRGALTPGVQLRGGTEGLSAAWYVPPSAAPRGVAPLPASALGNSWAATQQLAGRAGGQRVGGAPAGGLGPANVQAMRQQITAAQIRQSGLAAVKWAQSLSPVIGS